MRSAADRYEVDLRAAELAGDVTSWHRSAFALAFSHSSAALPDSSFEG